MNGHPVGIVECTKHDMGHTRIVCCLDGILVLLSLSGGGGRTIEAVGEECLPDCCPLSVTSLFTVDWGKGSTHSWH